ncbi:uncharacterized protein [Halyomorpha halys]|uniref:uncharacterized protein isoform X2 n=1 Tax=Halyomorpha halys TaxID=286706 RepID=UPI0006D4D52E|nr:uncharacterized protein LOC112210039 [Halyomorpha halys]
MSSQSTPKKSTARRRTTPKRNVKSANKLREERERRNADRTVKKQDHWSKLEEILNHVALVGLGDGVPLPIQQAVRQKLAASRKVLQRRGDPLDITKPLLELSNIISDHGVKTGAVVNRHLSGIRFFMEEATKEKMEDRTAIALNSQPAKKDIKGIEMKKMLDRAKNILSQLSDMNELRLTIKNSMDTILKTSGYLFENPTPTIYRLDIDSEKVAHRTSERFFRGKRSKSRSRSNHLPELELPPKSCNWKKIEGVLDHVMRVCQRPNINKELQQTMMTKVCASRKYFLKRSDPLQICKPLHELIDILNQQGLDSSETAKSHLEDVQAISISTQDSLDINSTTSSTRFRDKNCLEVRRALGQAKQSLNYLSDLNELKMIVKSSADLIQRGGIYTVEDLPNIMVDVEYDSIWDVSELVRAIEKIHLPNNLKVAVKVTMSRLRRILATPSGNTILQEHLENLRAALTKKVPETIAVACYSLIAAVTDYQNTHWNND